MQFDMFGSDEPEVPEQPEKIRAQPMVVIPQPASGAAELDEWTRQTQRSYLLYLIGAIQRVTYRDSSIHNARGVLRKLNGLGGEW